MASEIWGRYSTSDPDMPDTFLQFAQYQIDIEPDAYTESDDWDACMENMGVAKALRDAILMPEFDDLRYTQSAKYWVTDAFEMRFGSLESLTERIRSGIQTKQQGPYFLSSGNSLPPNSPNPIPLPASSSSVSLDKATKQKQGKRRQKRTKKSTMAGMETDLEEPSSIPIGFTTVWKAIDKQRCVDFLDATSGRIKLDRLASRTPTDFHEMENTVYFTPQRFIADRYALWNKNKASIAEVMMIQIDVPFELTEGKFGSTDFTRRIWKDSNPDCEWNQLIWSSRSNDWRPKNLAHLEKYGMLIGHISTGRYSNIASLPHHSSITDKHLLKVYDNGSWINGIQWMVEFGEGKRKFEEKCHGHAQLWSMG